MSGSLSSIHTRSTYNLQHFFPRDAMHKRGLCRRAVSVCPPVCLSFSCILSKRINISLIFLARVSTLTRNIDIAILSVCLSVRDVPVSDENGLTYRHSFFQHMVAQSF